ncbi:MAG: hypothetical protein HKN04_12990 [Rhodothermaceae bacterium]|nr:hypothetical protein [Rhodothermaceae bacterium]
MRSFVHYLPIATTVVAIAFSVVLYRHWRRKPEALYLMWWMLGAAFYGVGTLTESLTTLFGWHPWTFKAWYISGALLGGAPLAQGTVYLLMKRRMAHRLTVALLTLVGIAALAVLLSPLDVAAVEPYRLLARALDWQWVRAFSPFINIYAFVFLVGGAAWSAWTYRKAGASHRGRVWGNVLIAVGALLPGIGGSSARMGYVEVLYVTELIGLLLIWLGYRAIASDTSASVHANQRTASTAAAPA